MGAAAAGAFRAAARPVATTLSAVGSLIMQEVQRVKVLQGGSTVLMVNTMTMDGLPCVAYAFHPFAAYLPLVRGGIVTVRDAADAIL